MEKNEWSKVPISIKGYALLQIIEDDRIVQSVQMREKDVDEILLNRKIRVERDRENRLRNALKLEGDDEDSCGMQHIQDNLDRN